MVVKIIYNDDLLSLVLEIFLEKSLGNTEFFNVFEQDSDLFKLIQKRCEFSKTY